MSDEAQPQETAVADEPAAVEPTYDDVMRHCVAVESERRRWLKGITAFLASRSHDEDSCEAVQTASNMAAIAAYDRIARLFRSDDPIVD